MNIIESSQLAAEVPATRYTDMVECLRCHAQQSPDVEALVVVDATGERHFNYGQLDKASRALAARLQQRFAPGDRALILLDNNEDYVVAFFGCLYAGLIAVTAFVPASARPQHLSRLKAIADDAEAVCLLAQGGLREVLAQSGDTFGGADEIYVDEIDLDIAEHWQEYRPQSSDVAFLQYTSGSTSTPKGVMVSHGNLVANQQFIEQAYGFKGKEVCVSWLPLFHDMGLIGSLLQTIYGRFPLVLMSPSFFLERPRRWLDAITKFKGTVSGGPDFAFSLCLQRVKPKDFEQIDLSSWKIAFSGAEPIRYQTLESFTNYFAPTGFAASAPYPTYGLAEATLMLTGSVPCTGMTAKKFNVEALKRRKVVFDDESGQKLVGCGAVQAGHQIVLFDPATKTPIGDGAIGEIWAAGLSIAVGYWRNQQATDETFVEYKGQRFLRTGDLGFFYEGHLYISGRLKDVIILNGSNYYPQDIEQIIEKEIEFSRPGRVSAFPVGGLSGQQASQKVAQDVVQDSEGLGIAMELSRKHLKSESIFDIVDRLNQVLAPICKQQVAMLIVLNPGGLPKTSSGKLQRSACYKLWQQDSLDLYATWYYGEVSGPGAEFYEGVNGQQTIAAIEDELELRLANIWAAVLGVNREAIGRNSSFLRLGGNSQAATQIISLINAEFAIQMPAFVLFESPQLQQLADATRQRQRQTQRQQATTANESQPQLKRLADTSQNHFPLSAAQQRQWFLWQMEPHSSANQVIGSLALKGVVDVQLLGLCLHQLVERHESLRCVFELDEQGQAAARVLPSSDVTLNLTLQYQQSANVEQIAQQWFEQPFDLSLGPLLRAGVVERGDDDFVLVLVMHHIITDGWSMTVLVKELFALYYARNSSAKSAGVDANLEPLPLRYSDYSAWQQQWLASAEQKQQLAFWQEQLGNEHPVLEIPTDNPRQAVAEYNEARYRLELPTALIGALKRTARAHHSTVFVTMMTALQVLLYRYSNQADVRVGVPVYNRQDAQLEHIVGLFVNTLVMRTQISDDMTVAQLIKHVREQVLSGQQHQQLPFEQLVETLKVERSLSHSPVFQVMYNHRQQQDLSVAELDLAIESLDLTVNKRAQFELALDVVEFNNGALSVRFDYAKELFSAQSIAQLANHFERLLELIVDVDGTHQAIGQLPLLTDSQLQTLFSWGTKAIPSTKGSLAADPTEADSIEIGPSFTKPLFIEPLSTKQLSVHHAFERAAARTPDAVAIVFDGEQVTYGQLNQKANQLAHALLATESEKGVIAGIDAQSEVKIGIALERSIDMIVAVLAVLKTGSAYVPLDPQYPRERLAYMVKGTTGNGAGKASQLNLLLTRSAWQSQFATIEGVDCVNLEDLSLSQSATTNPEINIHPEQLAYVIYTSGSTGLPKGVAVSHRALSQHLDSAQDYIGVTADDKVLMFATLNFDSCLEQLFCPLVMGATVILRGDDLWDSQTFHQQLLEQKITVVDFTTAYWDSLLNDFARRSVSDFGALRQVNVGGEAMSSQSVNTWSQHPWGNARLVNVYGPTEAIVTASSFDCEPLISAGLKESLQQNPVPIGSPLASRNLYVLDANMQVQPVSVPGELYIGGELLARGYLDKPGLTAERFVADPFGEQGGRLYRTGDRVRFNHDGQLEYLGRTDSQVKIRGFRVEIDEIESVLKRQPQVIDAVVVTDVDANRLLAYVVPEADVGAAQIAENQQVQDTLETALRASLLQSMPEYMVPAVFITLDAIPMTPSGKLNRKGLPAPKPSKAAEIGLIAEPKNATEQQLIDIWTQLLDIEQVGRDSNFFEVGGHSLLALQLQNRIDERFNSKISVMDIFQYPTISKLAQFIDKSNNGQQQQVHQNQHSNAKSRAQKAQAGMRSRTARRMTKVKNTQVKSKSNKVVS